MNKRAKILKPLKNRQNALATVESTCRFLWDVDMSGGDVTTIRNVTSPEHCCALCRQDAACDRFTYYLATYPSETVKFTCYLKSPASSAPTDNFDGMVSGFPGRLHWRLLRHVCWIGFMWDGSIGVHGGPHPHACAGVLCPVSPASHAWFIEHRRARVQERGAHNVLLWTPPPPDLNPVKHAWSALVKYLI